MKKLWYLMLALPLCLGVVSCKKDNASVPSIDPPVDNRDDGKGETKQLDPDDAKDYLEDAANDFLKYLDTDEQKAAIQLADYLVYKYEEYEWDALEEHFEDIFDAKLVPALVQQARGIANRTHYIDWNAADFYGVFEANDRREEWVKVKEGNPGRLELRFTNKAGESCVAVAQASGETYVWESDEDIDEEDIYRIHVPQTVTFSLKEGNTEHISAVATCDARMNDHVNISQTTRITNITYNTQASITMNAASLKQSINYGTHQIYYASANLPKYELIAKKDRKTWGEWLEEYEDWEELLDKVGTAVAEVSVLGRVQVKANVSSIADAYDEYASLMRRYDNDNITEEKYFKSLANWYDDYAFCGVYFNSDVLQARLRFKAVKDTREVCGSYYDQWGYYNYGWHTEEEWTMEPQIEFEDGASYSMGEFADEFNDQYKDIIDELSKIIDRYLRLLKYNKLENPLEDLE